MATVTEEPRIVPPPEPPTPQQGVIKDARRRQRRRRAGTALALGVAAAAVVIASGLRGGGSEPRQGHPRLQPSAKLRGRPLSGVPTAIRLTPALAAGELGWADSEIYNGRVGGGGCCFLPTHEAEIIMGSKGFSSGPGWIATVIAAPDVAAVAVEGHRPVSTHSGGLPGGMRYAVVRVRHLGTSRGPFPAAFDARGQRLEAPGFETLPKRHEFEGPYAPHRWTRPAQPAAGACELSTTGPAGLVAELGAVVRHLKGYRVFGSRAFQSCASTVYQLDGSRLQAAILLDAEHPGRAPAGLPGMHPVAGSPGVFRAPSAAIGQELRGPAVADGRMTAQRLPDGWLVVADGRDAAQQLEVLRHLSAMVALTSTAAAGQR